jgi:hypothetical protein
MLPDQFILWKSVEREPGKKPAKVPCNARGKSIDHLDHRNWLSQADARAHAKATGLGIGFVLTPSDPYFLLDIDGQRDRESGQPTPIAIDVLARFNGAFVECSVSGSGYHVMGTCDAQALGERRHKWAGGVLEFYTHGRFVALGFGGIGDIGKDCTAALADFVPVRDVHRGVVPEDGAVPDWSGPTDDDELIRRALESKGSVAGMFGLKATFRQLWEADAAALAVAYPSKTAGEPYDDSAADMALASHLAFWTGKDVARMERLMWRSGLVRDKWTNHRTYLRGTLTKAAETVEKVRTAPDRTAVPAPLRPSLLTVPQMVKLFAGCVYVSDDHAILCPDGALLDQPRFKAVYGGHEFQMDYENARFSKDAFEAFTLNRAHRFPKVRRRTFRPDLPFGEIVGDAVNVFRMPTVATSDASVDPYVDVLARIMPDERDRQIFLSWCAAMVQSPGTKFQWAVVLQGTQGNGKTFLLRCLAEAVGMDVVHLPNPEDMNEKFNDYIEGRLLIGVEEIYMKDRRDMLERLKKYITNERIEVRAMQRNKRMIGNLTNWFFCTNHQDGVVKSRDDRRYAIFFTAQQTASDLERDGMSGDYFPNLWRWARNGGFAAVAGFLRCYQVAAEFDPRGLAHRAPKTSSTDAAIKASLGNLEQIVDEAVQNGKPGFRGGWISTVAVTNLLKNETGRNYTRNAIANVLKNLGYEKCRMLRDGRSPSPVFGEGSSRPRLYCLPENNQRCENERHFIAAQGYASFLTILPGGLP